ncbi:MAG: hypothetical protein ISS28_03145 [Candidatus Cloacimonetes bacterium]|nr:hypothetical protein [Candidatus Cloacimonadota bacterium]MBL7086087.1 hypothetical protein [Candidatus Cloacimonadota bacterium]
MKFISKISPIILFVLFLLLSTASIFSGIYKIRVYFPAILVAGYGILLLLQQKSKALSYHEKDSPYFLGFTLTLIALLRTFIECSSVSVTSTIIFEGIGIALSTTIAGLIFRYIIIISDIRERREKELLNILAEQQEKTIISYTNAQAGLLDLITSFHEHHQKIIEEELEHHDKFITTIDNMGMELNKTYSNLAQDTEKNAKLLKDQFDFMTQSLNKLVNNISESDEKFKNAQSAFINNIENYNEQLTSIDLKTSIETVQNSFGDISTKLQSLFNKIDENLKDFGENLNNQSNNIDESITNSILSANKRFQNIIQNFNTTLESVNTSISSNFTEFNKAVQGLSEQTESFGNVLKNAKDNISSSTSEILRDMKKGIEKISNDLKIIDLLLTDFTDTVKKHIKEFGKISK